MIITITAIFCIFCSWTSLGNLYCFFKDTEWKSYPTTSSCVIHIVKLLSLLIIPWIIYYIVNSIVNTDGFNNLIDAIGDIIHKVFEIAVYVIGIIIALVVMAICAISAHLLYQYAIEHKFIIWKDTFQSRFVSILKSLFVIIIGIIIGAIISTILAFIILFVLNISYDPIHPY